MEDMATAEAWVVPKVSLHAPRASGKPTDRLAAEYIRIPFADEGLIPIPALQTSSSENATASLANDYLMLSDIFATGWEALNFAGFKAGDTVAIFGAGPVGLMALHAAKIRGASRIYSIDYVPERLALAKQQGATPINFRNADPVEQIMALEPNGVTRSVDSVGYEQVNRNLTVQADVITSNMVAVTSTGGGMGTVGVYNMHVANSAVAPRASEVQDTMNFSLSDFFFGELKWQAGPSDPIGLAPELLALVASGVASPGFIVSDVISIEDAPEAYRRFERHEIVKAVIAFD